MSGPCSPVLGLMYPCSLYMVSLKDLEVCLCMFETAIRAASLP